MGVKKVHASQHLGKIPLAGKEKHFPDPLSFLGQLAPLLRHSCSQPAD